MKITPIHASSSYLFIYTSAACADGGENKVFQLSRYDVESSPRSTHHRSVGRAGGRAVNDVNKLTVMIRPLLCYNDNNNNNNIAT